MQGHDWVGFNTLLGANLQDPDKLGAAFQGFCGRLRSCVPALLLRHLLYEYFRQIFPRVS